ncbi:MAG TPA: aminoglycoside phosphotransferase family protein, partial [Sphaerochaeta sp.]|nr:aminoglycoside phosphotransferase family protein [Sphaerochaeta sp.]
LTDYLNGDVYYHIEREQHNLDRARTQIALMRAMDRRWSEL